MDGASFALAVISTADLCIKYGKKLIDRYKAFKNADDGTAELVLAIEGVWVKTETQVAFLRKIADSLGDRLASYQDDALLQLSLKLQAATTELENIIDFEKAREDVNRGKPFNLQFGKKVRYSLLEKSLRANTTLLEDWHKRFDPSWFLITLIADSSIDKQLADSPSTTDSSERLSVLKQIRDEIHNSAGSRRQIFLSANTLPSTPTPIPGSSANLTTLPDSPLVPVVSDRTAFPAGIDLPTAIMQVTDLARVLSAAAPATLSLLTCLGAIQTSPADASSPQFELLFRLPEHSRPDQVRSLRALLNGPAPSLDARFAMGAALARGVLAVHAAGFVHKNIRPETVLVVGGEENGRGGGDDDDGGGGGGGDAANGAGATVGTEIPAATALTPYLLGFSQFRHVALHSGVVGDMVWQRNFYRHPRRQGILPEVTYNMYHDVYSLGVLLLEIGVWVSFVSMEEEPRPAEVLDLREALEERNAKRAAKRIRERLLELAWEMLPSRMGWNYTEVVVACLTALDKGRADGAFTGEGVDEDDKVAVGLQFVENVLIKLEGVKL